MRRYCCGRDQERRAVYENLAIVRSAVTGNVGGSDGGYADLCVHVRGKGGKFRGRDDGGLGSAAARSAEKYFHAHCERCEGHKSRSLRHYVETSGHDRVGVG